MDTKKTFCISTAFYYPHTGGVETYVKRLTEELANKGYNIIIFTHQDQPNDKSIEKVTDKITIMRLECYNLMNGRFPIYKKNKNNKKIIQKLKSIKIDYFIINTRFYFISVLSAKIASKLNIKPVLIDHGSAHLYLSSWIKTIIVQIVEHTLTKIIKSYKVAYYGISKASVKWLKHFNINAKGVLPNAIDAMKFKESRSTKDWRKELGITSDDFIVYFVGRYIPEKGIEQLIHAAKSLKTYKNIHFVFSGSGQLEAEIDKQNKNYAIHNTRNLKPEEVSSLMQQANVLCLPTRSEGFSTTLLEAAACKLPSIISKVGGTDELIIDDKYGYLLPSTNPEDIKKAVLFMNENQELAGIMGENINANVIENFNWNITANKVIKACMLNNED